MNRSTVLLYRAGESEVKEAPVQSLALLESISDYAKRNAIDLASIHDAIKSEKLKGELERVVSSLSDEELRALGFSSPVIEAQVFEPVSILVTGIVLIGLILAARVQKISRGEVTFYKDIPKELVDVIKAGTAFIALK